MAATKKTQIRTVWRLAKKQCRQKNVDGSTCGGLWRLVTLRGNVRVRTVCVNSHVCTGEFAVLAQAPHYRKAA